jgi:hypothetical protein
MDTGIGSYSFHSVQRWLQSSSLRQGSYCSGRGLSKTLHNSKPAYGNPRIDQNDLQGLSEFLYLYKNPRKPRKPRLQATIRGFE